MPDPASAHQPDNDLGALWHVPQPPVARATDTFADITDDITEDPSGGATDDIADIPSQPLRAPGWRIEILGAGARYIWRRGSHHNRASAPGGPFAELDTERQQQYEANRQRYHATRALD